VCGQIYEALKLGDIISDRESAAQAEDFTVSPDWSQITEYDQEQDDEKGNPVRGRPQPIA